MSKLVPASMWAAVRHWTSVSGPVQLENQIGLEGFGVRSVSGDSFRFRHFGRSCALNCTDVKLAAFMIVSLSLLPH